MRSEAEEPDDSRYEAVVIYSSSDQLCDFRDNREQQEGDRGAAEGRDGRRRGGVQPPAVAATVTRIFRCFFFGNQTRVEV